jgi:hypothetical protein
LLQVILTGRHPDIRVELGREEPQVLGERGGYPQAQDGQRPGCREQGGRLLDRGRVLEGSREAFQVGYLSGDGMLIGVRAVLAAALPQVEFPQAALEVGKAVIAEGQGEPGDRGLADAGQLS